MQSLQARVDSFQKTRRIKRNPSKSSSSASVKWPHSADFRANPNTLAEAGFFFNPSWDDRDSVACFLCGKELSDWDADDDPFEIHYTKCQNSCPWAVVRCGLTEDLDSNGRFVFNNRKRLPSTKAMEKARLKTFQDWWPHDEERGHGATSIKMAQAGFVYTPQAERDDTVTCLYCNLSLGGWEADDDPVQEHRRRGNKSGDPCPFLALSEPSDDELAAVEIADPPPRAKRGKARTTTTTTSTKTRRKTRATRGKSAKVSAAAPRRSPTPSQPVSREQDSPTAPDVSVDIELPPVADPAPQPIARSPPLDDEAQQETTTTTPTNGPMHSLSDRPVFPPSSNTPSRPEASPDPTPAHPTPIVSLSPTGLPVIPNTQELTDHERTMSLEQWIRQEIDLGYERLFSDGRKQIELFKAKAAELRQCIDEL